MLFGACHGAVVYTAVTGRWGEARRPLLVCLAGIGNMPAVHLALDGSFPVAWRACVGGGVGGLAVGFVLFYVWRWPERDMSPGAADGRPWNSHVLWHTAAACAQLSYIGATFLEQQELLTGAP